MFQFRKVQLIPLGQNGYAKFNKFQFRKVQLIHNHERNIYNLYEFQFRKVQLIRHAVERLEKLLDVSIPQGPINTCIFLLFICYCYIVSIPQGPINTPLQTINLKHLSSFQFRKVQLILSHQSNNHHYK